MINNDPIYSLYKSLCEKNIDYYILSNKEVQPICVINLFVPSFGKESFLNVISDLGWYKRKEPENIKSKTLYCYLDEDKIFYLDVKYELIFIDKKQQIFKYYKSFNEILKFKRGSDFDGWRLFGADEIRLYLAHLYFDKKELKNQDIKRYKNYLELYESELIENEKKYFEHILIKISNGKFFDEFCESFIHLWFTRSKQRRQLLRKINFSYGYTVLVLGTDGTGKTSLISNLNNISPVETKNMYLGTGDGGWVLDTVKKMHNSSKKRILQKVFKNIILPLEFSLRVIRGKKNGKHKLILIDRFPGWAILSNSKLTKTIFKVILPKPQLVIFLYGDAHQIYERKKERDVKSILKDTSKFRKVANLVSDNNVFEVNTTELDEDKTSRKVLKHIINNKNFRSTFFEEPKNKRG